MPALGNLAARESDTAVRRGKHVNTTFRIATTMPIISASPRADCFNHAHHNTELFLRPGASRDAWEKLWSPKPLPGFTDIFALVKKKLLRIEGDLHPFMSHLLYFKGVLAAAAAPRSGGVA